MKISANANKSIPCGALYRRLYEAYGEECKTIINDCKE